MRLSFADYWSLFDVCQKSFWAKRRENISLSNGNKRENEFWKNRKQNKDATLRFSVKTRIVYLYNYKVCDVLSINPNL